MKVYKCGTLVIIKLANLKGMITCASIRFDKVIYEITYYDGTEQKTVWVNENEVEVNGAEFQKIGFIK